MSLRFNGNLKRAGTVLMMVACGAWAGIAPVRGQESRGQEFRITDDPAHLDELAGALQQVSNTLCWEMHRYHRDKPDFNDAYRPAKELWSMAGALKDALRAGPVDDRDVVDQVTKMNDLLVTVEKTCSRWGDGVRPSGPTGPAEERTVVVPGSGVDVEIPLLFGGGIRVGRSPRMVVTEPAVPALPRRAFHPNSHGSRRALEREMAVVRTAISYLLEDTGITPAGSSGSPNPPRPMPPETNSGPALAPPTKIVPSGAKGAKASSTPAVRK